jgi:hypothetical protein
MKTYHSFIFLKPKESKGELNIQVKQDKKFVCF